RVSAVPRPGSGPGELDHDLVVVVALLERVGPVVERHRAGDEAAQPVAVGGGQGLDRLLEVPAVGVHGAEDHVVLEHELVVEGADVEVEGARSRYAGEAYDRPGRGMPHGPRHQLGDPGA